MGAGETNGSGGNGAVKRDPVEIFRDGVSVKAGIREALRDVRLLHKRMGVGMVVMENGKMVEIPPEEIVVDLPEGA